MKKLHIALLSIHSSPIGPVGRRDTGGMSIYVKELSRWLGEKGHLVDIYTVKSKPAAKQIVQLSPGVRLIHLHTAARFIATQEDGDTAAIDDVVTELEFLRKEAKVKYDIIHSNYWLSGRVGEVLKKIWFCPHVITFHTLASAKIATAINHVEHSFRIDEEQRLVRGCDIILAPTVLEKQRLAELNGDPTERIQILGCGVDLEKFRPLPSCEDEMAAVEQVRAVRILYAGRFDPMKGLSELLQAFKRVHEHSPGTQLVLIGGEGPNSSFRQGLAEKVAEFGIGEHVHFPGRIQHDQMAAQYNATDIVVVPSRYESFGLVTLEALACGTPVAATRVGIAADVIEQGVNGFLAEPGDPESLAAALRGTLGLAEKRERQRIRSRVLNYGWENVATRLIDVYNNSLNAPD
jgi:D-inositol-3-phosphate glycosyltransferase